MKVFISWSGETSKKVALLLREWLPMAINAIEPYVSAKDIDKGSAWFSDIAGELKESEYGIVCLSKENLSSEWIHYEAGAIATKFDEGRTTAFLIDVESSDVKPPLSQFQHTSPVKDDIHHLLSTLNGLVENPLSDLHLAKASQKWWPELEDGLKDILAKAKKTRSQSSAPHRTDRELLEELLSLSRRNARDISKLSETEEDLPSGTIIHERRTFTTQPRSLPNYHWQDEGMSVTDPDYANMLLRRIVRNYHAHGRPISVARLMKDADLLTDREEINLGEIDVASWVLDMGNKGILEWAGPLSRDSVLRVADPLGLGLMG